MIRERDWSHHPLGPPESWPNALRVALGLVVNSPESMILCWGADLWFFFNTTYFPLLGPRLSWAMGAKLQDVWADAWDQAKPIIDEAMAGRANRYVDMPWKLATDRGSRDTWWTFSYSRVLDADGTIAGLFIFTNETTGRILADAALKESQSKLAAAVEDLRRLNETLERRVEDRTRERDRVWRLSRDLLVVGGSDGIFRAANPAWTSILGYDPHAVVGHSFMDFVWHEDIERTKLALDAAAGVKDLTSFENRYRHKDGTQRWISWHTSVEGDLVYAYGRDVTIEKEQAAILRKTEAALRQSQKMEAVGQLTGGIAHDFNNLLTGVTGSLELLNTRLAQGRLGDIERYATAAHGAAKRAAALTHRLLAFSRQQTLDPKPTNANRLVAGMVDLIRRTVGPAIEIEVVAADDLWSTLVDPPQLESALLNLCINARDAMPNGGAITIETANTWLDDRAAKEREMEPGPYISLDVSDKGVGMPPDVIAQAFDPFFTTKPIGQGTGLGLSMVYGFVLQSGGQVRIRSEVGLGTNVELYLPRHLGDAAAQEATPNVVEAPRAGAGETVLVVDDEPILRMLVSEVLSELGYAAIEAADGASALKVLQSDARIDLVVTDVGLPGGMNGRQMIDAAQVGRPNLKVLFITGYAETAAISNGQLRPGMHVMTKPFDMDVLAARIKSLIAGA